MSRPRRLLLVLGFVAIFALPVQMLGCTQTSQLALTRALASGTARIDRWQATTCDKAWFRGHYYSVKAPGLALSALPAFVLLRAVGLLPASATTTIWLLGLATVLPAVLLLLYLVARVAERASPGSGLLAAVALGTCTLVLPFGGLWFGHVPAATFGFASFALLLRARSRAAGSRADAAAGLLAGCAVLFEYPVALLAVTLGVYVAASRGARSAASFAASLVPAVAAIFLYNALAFGSVGHFSYEDAVTVTGNTGHDVVGANSRGFFGITWPSPHALAELLVSSRGLLTVTPICLLGAMGIVAFYRRARAEACLAAAAVVLFLLYNSGYTLSFGGPFGGDAPGPRFLVAVLPFLVFPIGLAARRAPGSAVALLGASAAMMIVATATGPLVGEGETHRWIDALRGGEFVHTLVSLLGGGSGWAAIVPFVAAAIGLAGVGVARAARGSGSTSRTFLGGASALTAWVLVVVASGRLFEAHGLTAGLVLLALAAAGAAAAVLFEGGEAPAAWQGDWLSVGGSPPSAEG